MGRAELTGEAKLISETKTYIRQTKMGEVYLFKPSQLHEIEEYLEELGLTYQIKTADYYFIVKFN
jgi:hypothetical protein